MKYTFTCLLCYLVFCGGLNAQEKTGSNSAYQVNVPLHQETISGGYYVDPPYTIEGDPYLFSKSFEPGSLTINGILYADIPLLYNIYSDEIITFHPDHKKKVLIKTDKINAFTLLSDPATHFVKIEENPGYAHHANGFYEQVINGKASLLSKHYKTRKEKKEFSKYTSSFLQKYDFWLQINGELRPVNNKNDVVELLQLDKKEIRRLAKENNMVYKFDKRAYLKFIVSHYNQQVG